MKAVTMLVDSGSDRMLTTRRARIVERVDDGDRLHGEADGAGAGVIELEDAPARPLRLQQGACQGRDADRHVERIERRLGELLHLPVEQTGFIEPHVEDEQGGGGRQRERRAPPTPPLPPAPAATGSTGRWCRGWRGSSRPISILRPKKLSSAAPSTASRP